MKNNSQMFVAVYRRLKTREVRVGDLLLGNNHPIRMQTMTTPDTMDTEATVAQAISCIESGAELIRITAPSKKEAENLGVIKNELRKLGFNTPLVADIHFTPNAAEIAARLVEKVRINPGNYIDKKKFEVLRYTDDEYREEIDRIRKRFTPLLNICKEYGTALRIGTNHGSLSDRIMSRYGDTPMGMVESAMEFLRIARYEGFHNVVLSMKSSNPQVMVQAYRLLVQVMNEEFGECYPLHLGVTEAGDGEDGRVKSALGIGTLLEDGIGDTIRVSLTEEPELEIPVCRDLIKRYSNANIPGLEGAELNALLAKFKGSYSRRISTRNGNIGEKQVPVIIADFRRRKNISQKSLKDIGYRYDERLDKWIADDAAADYILVDGAAGPLFPLPGMLKVVTSAEAWKKTEFKSSWFPLFSPDEFLASKERSILNFIKIGVNPDINFLRAIKDDPTVVLLLAGGPSASMPAIRQVFWLLEKEGVKNPAVLLSESAWETPDEHLVHFATVCGALLIEGFGDGISLALEESAYDNLRGFLSDGHALQGRNYTRYESVENFLNITAFSILQASRTRISKTEYISCPSCGRTLFDLQETTAKIRAVTNHLKGVKIAIMGCIVNGPGEMADADFGYVGSGIGKITLYRGKEVVKRALDSEIAVEELIRLLKDSGVWVEPPPVPVS